MPERHDCLSNFAAGLTDGQLSRLQTLGEIKAFEEGELILIAGERSQTFYILLSGGACVEMATDFCAISLQALNPGDAFGWSSLLDRYETLFQVRALDGCRAMCLDGRLITALCKTEPVLGVSLLLKALQTAAGRVRGMELRLAEFCGLARVREEKYAPTR